MEENQPHLLNLLHELEKDCPSFALPQWLDPRGIHFFLIDLESENEYSDEEEEEEEEVQEEKKRRVKKQKQPRRRHGRRSASSDDTTYYRDRTDSEESSRSSDIPSSRYRTPRSRSTAGPDSSASSVTGSLSDSHTSRSSLSFRSSPSAASEKASLRLRRRRR